MPILWPWRLQAGRVFERLGHENWAKAGGTTCYMYIGLSPLPGCQSQPGLIHF